MTLDTFAQNSNTGAVFSKNRTTSAANSPSQFGCALSTLNSEKEDQRYQYQAFFIRFPQKIMDDANGEVTHRSFALRSSRAEKRTPEFLNKKGVVRYLTCQIPNSPKAVEILETEMQKFGMQSWYNDVERSSNGPAKSKAKSGDMVWTCSYVPGDGYGNISSTITIEGTTYTTYYFHEECGYEYVDGDGPEEPVLNDPFGGGGGGIGDPGDTNGDPNPCESTGGQQIPMNGDGEIIGEIIGCGSEEAIIAEQLKNLVEEDEFALLEVPCGEIPKWQSLAQHEVPANVITRLEETNALDGYEIQKLEDASGAVVNMDYFGVTVPANEIPNGWSAAEYLDHLRTNINDYVDTNISRFEFYPGLTGEEARWNSDNPLGTVFSIQMMVLGQDWIDDGSVVTSSYSSSSWIFSTVYTYEDGYHPVSGNRKFGFTNNGDGSYFFYTRGIDRISTTADNLVNFFSKPFYENGIIFDSADALWISFQDLIAEDFGAMSVVFDSTTWRPNYAKVDGVLNGSESFATLGCD